MHSVASVGFYWVAAAAAVAIVISQFGAHGMPLELEIVTEQPITFALLPDDTAEATQTPTSSDTTIAGGFSGQIAF
ncbi:hypothetical protein ElyMa_002437500 [Elysia marginata]|uniref:Uncharacterized protein n=1 Tax=Elysia marginata TaxID=1093978 RepID=A0AAV4GHS7_9GAST|nr:hypothetical protein ElyMa_002437500 [Elysia marginata]